MTPSTPRHAAGRPGAGQPGAGQPAAAPKAGRNLPLAIAVGVALGAIVIASLAFDKRGFVVVACLASVIGTLELLQAFVKGRLHPPVIPTLVSAGVVPFAAYLWGPGALAPVAVLAVLVVVLWAAAAGSGRSALRDAGSGVLIVLYPGVPVAFALLLLRPEDGIGRIVTFVVVTICSDIGGYAAGVLFGKHPMAPSVSPKKSWEGFAGSAIACVVAGIVCVVVALAGPWWIGLLLGLAVVVAATVGDLCESMIKRDLGIKDMSNFIPGHGGLMDRLDSLALSVPVTWAILAFVSTS